MHCSSDYELEAAHRETLTRWASHIARGRHGEVKREDGADILSRLYGLVTCSGESTARHVLCVQERRHRMTQGSQLNCLVVSR